MLATISQSKDYPEPVRTLLENVVVGATRSRPDGSSWEQTAFDRLKWTIPLIERGLENGQTVGAMGFAVAPQLEGTYIVPGIFSHEEVAQAVVLTLHELYRLLPSEVRSKPEYMPFALQIGSEGLMVRQLTGSCKEWLEQVRVSKEGVYIRTPEAAV